MNAAPSAPHADRDVLKRAAAEAAVQLVENDMIVGLGSGSTAGGRNPASDSNVRFDPLG